MNAKEGAAWENSMGKKKTTKQSIKTVCGGKIGKRRLGRARYRKKVEQ